MMPDADAHHLAWTAGYLILLLPTLSRINVNLVQVAAFATGVPANLYAFTATLGIPLPLPAYEPNVSKAVPTLSRGISPDLSSRLRALRPIIPNNARP